MRKLYFVLLFVGVLLGNLLSAQSLPSTLLWKISGNGLQKPSYLYGTMHLTDERVFNIGDSLYKAIENSEGFAIEINPDDFTPFIIDEAKRSIFEKQRLRDMMSEKDFKKYGKTLAKKLNKNENDITTADVLNEKNKWIEESYKTGTMQTFLDAYLFDVARRQGKWTGGVEDMQDQENLMSYLVDESDIEELATNDDKATKAQTVSALDQMIALYVKGDLNGIESASANEDSLYHDKLLTRRNKKMAMRMDSLGRVRSMVFAVGAAHLPGNDGLIALLKEKGFTVTPVFSTKKLKPSDYKVHDVALPWYDVKDESDSYSASMPGKPGDMNFYGIVNMKMYFDIFKSTLYITAALHTPYAEKTIDSLMGVMAGYYFDVSDYSKGKPVTINNVPGREFMSNNDKYSRGYLLYKEGIMYMAVAMSMKKKDTATENSINQFLHSYVIHEANSKDDTKYVTYTNTEKAYSIDVPTQPKPAGDLPVDKGDKSVTRDLQTAIDPKSGDYFFFGTNEASSGYFIPNDSVVLASIEESQKKKFTSYTIDTMYMKDGHRVLELGGILVQAPVMMKAHYEFRGNRWYALVSMYDPKKENVAVDRFFSSFKMLDYTLQNWKQSASGDALFSTWTPGEIKMTDITDSTDLSTRFRYDCFDTARANDYSIVSEAFSNYYWQKNDSVLLAKMVANDVHYNDTILSQKSIDNGGVKGIELVTQQSGSNNIKRSRLLLNDNKLYTMITMQPSSELYNINNNRFFEDFRFANISSNDRLFKSKASLLLTDLLNQDSLIHAKAKSYLSIASFSKEDLPLLHDALLKTYSDSEEEYNTTKTALQNAVIKVADSSSYLFAKEHYPEANGQDKNIWLGIMLTFPTSQHFIDIKTMLLQQPPTEKPSYSLVSGFTDSLSLAASIFPDLLPLLKDTIMAPSLIRIAKSLLDSAYISTALLQPYEQPIIRLSQQYVSRLKNDPDDFHYNIYTMMAVLADLNSTDANTALQNWTTVKKNPYLKMSAASHLLSNNQVLNPSVWQSLAADKATRTELYDTLQAYKKVSLFPKQYLTQQYFAESMVDAAASDDDDDEPSNLTYLTQKVISFKSKQARFFFYKVTYGEDDDVNYRLACAGPFSITVSDVSTKHASGEMYTAEDFDPDNLPTQMTALIKQMEDWFDWEPKKVE